MRKPLLRQKLFFIFTSFIFTAALLLSASVNAHAQDSTHKHEMPGMDMSKPKKPAKKQTAGPKKTEPKKAEPEKVEPGKTEPEKNEMQNMPGMPAPAATPAPSPLTTPTPAPAQTPSPDTSPGKMDESMAMPKASTQPATQQPGTGAVQDNSAGAGNTETRGGQPHDMHAMPGMNMPERAGTSGTGRISASDPNALMIMMGQQMEIRVGTSSVNSIAMGQMGSGTSWQPSTTPMYMWVKSAKDWLIFFHGEAKLGVNSQGGPRGVTKFESQNWLMPMAFRRVGDGTLQLRGMFSFEPFTFSGGGSPQLFQTGETYKGQPLVDRQHPHDLLMELSATYTMPIGERATWFTYLGFPGEPALGPTAFMHRMSASENPSAPLTHHLQDSTHISFGVFTTGFTYRWLKLEGSLFNGREPDENRYNFEFNPWNSRSVRLSVAPNDDWSMQWSYGLLKNPEALETG
ncbi:MAG TPA: hypothetical protein VGB17_16050, partial [Pyrinomonadaceae bacterium]